MPASSPRSGCARRSRPRTPPAAPGPDCSLLRQGPLMHPAHIAEVAAQAHRQRPCRHHVADAHPAARLEHTVRFLEDPTMAFLRQVDDAVGKGSHRPCHPPPASRPAPAELHLAGPASAALRCARSISTASCPARSAARGSHPAGGIGASMPAPLPISSTVSPGLSEAIAVGFPQPSDRLAASAGAAARSAPVPAGVPQDDVCPASLDQLHGVRRGVALLQQLGVAATSGPPQQLVCPALSPQQPPPCASAQQFSCTAMMRRWRGGCRSPGRPRYPHGAGLYGGRAAGLHHVLTMRLTRPASRNQPLTACRSKPSRTSAIVAAAACSCRSRSVSTSRPASALSPGWPPAGRDNGADTCWQRRRQAWHPRTARPHHPPTDTPHC